MRAFLARCLSRQSSPCHSQQGSLTVSGPSLLHRRTSRSQSACVSLASQGQSYRSSTHRGSYSSEEKHASSPSVSKRSTGLLGDRGSHRGVVSGVIVFGSGVDFATLLGLSSPRPPLGGGPPYLVTSAPSGAPVFVTSDGAEVGTDDFEVVEFGSGALLPPFFEGLASSRASCEKLYITS